MSTMAIDRFKNQLASSKKCIEFCLAHSLFMPALIQIYSLIDAMAWINRPESKEDTDKECFIDWVSNFMLKDTSLECTALDLYAARCAVVHTMTPRARLIREGKARSISYAWGSHTVSEIKDLIKEKETAGKIPKGENIAVHFDDLYQSLLTGIDNFNRYVYEKKSNFEIFYKRISNYYEEVYTG